MFQLISRPPANSRSAFILPVMLMVALQVTGCSSSEQRAQNYYEDGAKLVAQHKYFQAAVEFRNAIRLKKDMLPAWRGLAQVEEFTHQWTELVGALRSIVNLDPKDVDAKLKLARLMLYGGATDQALKLVNSFDPTEDANAKVLALKAAVFLKLKDNTSAVSNAQAALKIDPNNVDATVVLAASALDGGDPKAALQILNSAPGVSDKDLGIQFFKIKIFEQLGDLPQIEALLQKLVELYPDQTAFRKQLVKFYIDQHRTEDAEKQLRAIAAADPKNTQAALDLVRFLYTTKGAATARAELVSRIAAGGDVFAYQIALAEFDFSQGNFDDSFKLLQTLANNSGSAEQRLAAKIKLAELNLDRKNVVAADALVTDILNTDSRNIDGLRLRALIHMSRGQLDPAISDLREALNDAPRSTDLMLLLATAYERSGSIELAEKEFADATRVSNYDPNVGLNYVAFLRRRGSIQRAQDVLTDLANRQPNNLAILSALAEVKLSLRDWAGAQEIGEAIKRIGGAGGGLADQILGTALNGEDKVDQSIAAFQSAAATQPSAVQPMVALVGELVRAKQTDRAVTFLQAVLKANPANAEALVLLGSIEFTVNNAPDKAMADYMAAIEKQPKDVIGYRALADLYVVEKKPDAALLAIQDGLKQLPDNIPLHMSLAGLLEQSGNYDGAISEYEYVQSQQPGSMIVANNLASLLTDHRTDKASLDQALALAAVLRKSQVPQFKDTLGWVSYRSGDYKTAVSLLNDAATALPDVALIRYHLGMGYAAVGQNAMAAEQFKAALTKSPSDELAERIKAELRKTAT